MQVNMNKAWLATVELVQVLKKNDFIGFVSEPYTAYGKVVAMPKGYKVFHVKAQKVVRAALVVPCILSPIFLDHLSNDDCAVAMVRHDDRNIVVASLYLDRNVPIKEQKMLDDIMEYCEQHDCGVVLGMDSNAHSDMYSEAETDERGEDLEEFIFRHALHVANVGNTPTFQTSRARSIIDVTLVKGATLEGWQVSTEYNGSDHHSIYFSIVLDMTYPKDFRPWHSADWELFRDKLKGNYNIPKTVSIKKLDKLVSYLYSRLNDAIDAACPTVLSQPKLKGNVWMSPYLKHLRRRVRTLYKRQLRTGSHNDVSEYLSTQARLRKQCRKAKAKSWRKFVSDTENEHSMCVLSRIAQHKERNAVNLVKKPDGSMTLPGSDTISRLAKVHFPDADRIEMPEGPKFVASKLVSSDEISDKYGDYVNIELVSAALKKFKPYKAPGPDGFKPIIFRRLPWDFLEFLTFIYKCCLHFRYTPFLWQMTKVIWLPKAGKDDYLESKSFRPISLSNFLLKGLERLITWRMDEHLKYYPIHKQQHGFMKGRSTEGALSNTVNYIESQLFRGKVCVGVFLDIKSAYDTMCVEQIRNSLFLHGGDDDLVGWYYHYLQNRLLSIELHDECLIYHTAVGFPQGGVASAKFWVIAFNPAIEILNSGFIEGNGYADDCAAVFGGPDFPTILTRLQRMLNKLVDWGRSCNLSFNAAKSVAMTFSRGKKEFEGVLRLGNEPMQFVQSVRYLGITLDCKLYWNLHVADRVARAKKFLMKMANIAKATWGPKPHLMRWVYRCVVRPMILYGSVVWAHEAKRPKNVKLLRHVNRMAMCTYTKFPRSTPTQMLEIATDTFPLHTYLVKEALCAFIRLLPLMRLGWEGRYGNVNYSVSHRRFWYDMLVELDISGYESLDVCFEINRFHGYFVHEESFKDAEFVHKLPGAAWKVYTDGSKMAGRIGVAYRILHNDQVVFQDSRRISDHASVFQAEIYAIALAADVLSEHEEIGVVRFHVDAQAALLALKSSTIEACGVLSAATKLDAIDGRVDLVWVKAHAGNKENEEVDKLAKEATKNNMIHEHLASKNQIRTVYFFCSFLHIV